MTGMNFYEELGIPSTAGTEEIREAYRSVARLLHPDQHQDENLRRLAELQMRRLNTIAAVLTDPEQRRRYDQLLLQAARPHKDRPHAIIVKAPPPRLGSRSTSAAFGSWIWVATVAIGLGSVLWYFAIPQTPLRQAGSSRGALTESPRAVEFRPAPEPAPMEILAASPESIRPALRSAPPAAAPSRRGNAAKERFQGLQGKVGQAKSAVAERPLPPPLSPAANLDNEVRGLPSRTTELLRMPETLQPPPGTASAAPPALQPQAPAAMALPESNLVGSWYYPKPKLPQSTRTLYPPEFIELTMVEETGVIRGRYRARYQVHDKPISPDVNFRFEGPLRDTAYRFNWTAGGGAKGEVEIKMLSSNSMEVNWAASELGQSLGLAAGTAVLVRRSNE